MQTIREIASVVARALIGFHSSKSPFALFLVFAFGASAFAQGIAPSAVNKVQAQPAQHGQAKTLRINKKHSVEVDRLPNFVDERGGPPVETKAFHSAPQFAPTAPSGAPSVVPAHSGQWRLPDTAPRNLNA